MPADRIPGRPAWFTADHLRLEEAVLSLEHPYGLDHLRAVADSLQARWGSAPEQRPALTLIQGGRDAR